MLINFDSFYYINVALKKIKINIVKMFISLTRRVTKMSLPTNRFATVDV